MENEERIDLFEYYKKDGKHSLASLFLLPSLALNPKLTNWENLKKCGYLSIFLYDNTIGFAEYYPNSLLIIFNPSKSFKEEYWEEFSNVMKGYSNFICENYYDEHVYGYWMKINPYFGHDLRFYFKQGKYSMFPQKYIGHLAENEQKICRKDLKYQRYLENKLGLEEGELDDQELGSKPEKEEYTFVYGKINNI